MNTTSAEAALQANVTVATIRAWCRHGVIAAVKTAGRWIIDTASLAHRIAIAAWRTPKAPTMTDPHVYTLDELKALSLDEKKAIRRDAIARGEAARARIRAAIRLPELTGTDKQVEWATTLRANRIEEALACVSGTRFGEVALRLNIMASDPLRLNDLKLVPWDNDAKFTTETELLDALHTALTASDRTTAAWWIDHRYTN